MSGFSQTLRGSWPRGFRGIGTLCCFFAVWATGAAAGDEPEASAAARLNEEPLGVTWDEAGDVCGTLHPDSFYETYLDAIERGEIPDPALRALAPVTPRRPLPMGGGAQSLTPDDIFAFEDTENLLTSNFSDGALFQFMGDATEALITEHGDNFDFVGFFLNFSADHQIGAAFYLGIFNTIDGLGLNSFNRRGTYGVPGDTVQGFIMMWRVNDWSPGDGGNANFTRLVLGQEFEHRWAMFLDPILGDRRLQGANGPCGRSAHWNFRVDGQGSGMEIAEWTGESPAFRAGGTLHFNTDLGGVFSATDLYLMGYLSPSQMNARNSELRYMDESANCGSPYNGPILDFNSLHISQTNGMRIPTAQNSQHDYRTGWIMIHRPNDPPSPTEIDRALGILEQHQLDWFHGTLGVGTMSNSITETLGGDFDGDGDADLDDYNAFDDCFTGPGGGPPAAGCEVFDADMDGDIDLHDFGVFMRAFDGDCGVSFTRQPADEFACENGAAELSVEADGELFGYQWTLDGIPISGATNATLIINSVDTDDLGEYRVSAFGACHTAHSETADLAFHPPANYVIQPQPTGACPGGSAEFTALADGVEPLSYQWRFMGGDLPGETGTSLIINDVSEEALGDYQCVVTDGCGVESPSDVAPLVFATEVVFTLQPEGGDVCQGEDIFLIGSASGFATYQWFKDGDPIVGETSFFLFIPDATPDDAGVYHLEATGPCSSDVSDDAVVTVIDCG